MYALIIDDKVLIFDLTKHYGIHLLDSTNLEGYLLVLNVFDVLNHFKNNYYNENEIYKIEKYSFFMFRICQNYLKDLFGV